MYNHFPLQVANEIAQMCEGIDWSHEDFDESSCPKLEVCHL